MERGLHARGPEVGANANVGQSCEVGQVPVSGRHQRRFRGVGSQDSRLTRPVVNVHRKDDDQCGRSVHRN